MPMIETPCSPARRDSTVRKFAVFGFARYCKNLTFYDAIKLDEFVKSRHSGENRSPDGLQLPL